MDDNKAPKPFSQEYVLRTTAKHIRKSIDISIRKTMDRMNEFKDDHVKANEVFRTLTILQAMKQQIEGYQVSVNEDPANV
jgi:hypothetical protein